MHNWADPKNPGSMSDQDLPLVCERCLGNDSRMRMLCKPMSAACKVCEKTFNLFLWNPSNKRGKPRLTEICKSCARLKNVCQCCILDVNYGLPVKERDQILGVHETVPHDPINREYFLKTNAARLAKGDGRLVDYDALIDADVHEKLSKRSSELSLNSTDLAPICSHFSKGTCKKGNQCPFRHVNETKVQSIRSLYHGI